MVIEKFKDKLLFISETSKLMSIAVNRIVEDFCAKSGMKDPLGDLRISQIGAVLNIWRKEPCCLSDLVGALHVSKSTASLMVTRLVEKGIVIRETDPENRRRVVITIEPKVRKYLTEVDEAIVHWLERISGQLGMDRIEQWYEVMVKLNTVLENDSWSNA